MGLVSVGAIAMDHRNPQMSWGSSSLDGIAPVRISGQSPVASVQALWELVNNPAGRETKGSHTGVKEHLVFDGDLVGMFTGWYLLESCEMSAERPWSVTDFTPFTLTAAYLGDMA